MNLDFTYTKSDAILEILIMLFIAFLIGWFLRMIYDNLLFECIDDEDHQKELKEKYSYKENKEELIDKKEKNKIEEKENFVEIEDDLKLIEGVGPKIESLLKNAGVKTFRSIADSDPESLRKILLDFGGERYAFHDPTTWPDQARLALEDRFEELKEYQAFLNGGRA